MGPDAMILVLWMLKFYEVEQFYEDLQDLIKLTPQKDVLFIIGDLNAKRTECLCLFPRQPFNITVIQVSAPSTDAKDAEIERFYEDL